MAREKLDRMMARRGFLRAVTVASVTGQAPSTICRILDREDVAEERLGPRARFASVKDLCTYWGAKSVWAQALKAELARLTAEAKGAA